MRPRPGRGVGLATVLAVLLSTPAAAEPRQFRIEAEGSEISFRATSRFMDATGRFRRFAGEVLADPADLGAGRVTITIEAASLDTGNGLRDRHLRSGDFFDVERYPTIRFASVRVEGTGPQRVVVGRLTVKDVTREVAVPVEVDVGEAGLVARGEIDLERSRHGVDYRSFLNPIGETVRVAFRFRGRPVR